MKLSSKISALQGKVAARRGAAFPFGFNALGCPNHQSRPFENKRDFPALSNETDVPENENPGALAGATGADRRELPFEEVIYRTNLDPAMALCVAIVKCDPYAACLIMEKALGELTAGAPIAPLLSIMDEASFWADLATPAELKAYALACFTRMNATEKAAFLAYVAGGGHG